jgi:hypothetical protein
MAGDQGNARIEDSESDVNECDLSRHLRKALQKVINRSHACHKSSVLIKHFPFLERRQGRWLESAAKQEDVDKVYAKYDLEKFLSALTSYKKEAAGSHSSAIAFRPSGSPESDMQPFLIEAMLPVLREQEKCIHDVESETAELMEMVSRSQQQLNATVEQYEHEVAMLRQVRETLQTIEPVKDKLKDLELKN